MIKIIAIFFSLVCVILSLGLLLPAKEDNNFLYGAIVFFLVSLSFLWIFYALFERNRFSHKTVWFTLVAIGISSLIIPTYIRSAMPKWFGTLFLLTLLAAAMSTLSSQFHALGTSIGRDVYEQIAPSRKSGIGITRGGIMIGIIIAVIISYLNKGEGYIIARATAIFFGLCASTFLPAMLAGLFWKRASRIGVISSMLSGFATTAFWLLFIKDKEARALGLCFKLTGKHSLLLEKPSWPVVDPIMVALPIALVVLIAVSFLTKPPSSKHLEACFGQKRK